LLHKQSLNFAAATMLALTAAAPAALLVAEFVPDPSGTDVDREWFEIYNSGTTAIDLTGYAAGDGTNPTNTASGEGMGVFPAGSSIDPGQVIVIAANALGFESLYGFAPNYEFAKSTSTLGNNAAVPDLTQKEGWGSANGTLALANTGDDVAILTPESTADAFTFVDGANHGNITTFYTGAATLAPNQSYERVPADIDTNALSDFTIRASGAATPGVVTVPEPAAMLSLAGVGAMLIARRRRA
jgi:hypothetical protein